MQIRLPYAAVLERKRNGLATFTAAICLVCLPLAQGTSQLTNTKRITAVSMSESAEGSRVRVNGDSVLDDYEAFRRGNRFYVRIPAADFVAAPRRFQGNGFEDVQVQKVGHSVVISFRLYPGANARVISIDNRLDVIFTSPNNFVVDKGATAVRNRVTRSSAREKSASLRAFSKTGSDVAGPIPPASPTAVPDYSISNPGSNVTPLSRSSQLGASQPNAAAPTPAPNTAASPMTTPYPTAYPPRSSTYIQPPVQPVAQTSNTSFDLESRSRTAFPWVRANKTMSAVAAVVGFGLLGVLPFVLYRRQQSRHAAITKASRGQPKYILNGELEEIFSSRLPSETSNGGRGGYVDHDATESLLGEISTSQGIVRDPRTREPM